MIPQELKGKLQGMKLPESHRMSAWENISDIKRFLQVEFSIVEELGDKYAKAPEWDRLVRFYESLAAQDPDQTQNDL